MISTAIQQLVNYGLDTGLILSDDEIYIRNQLLMTMQLDSFTEPEGEVCYKDLESILKTLVDDAVSRGVCADNSTARDLFDTKLMGVLTPRPSIVRANFEERYEKEGPQAATDWFYEFSQDTDYIRRYRIKRDLKWVTKTPYGDLDITINLSKPEKDPKAIAAAKLAPQSAYPKCQLCAENEGYAGRMNHPARENHRIIPLTINDSAWNLQYSPYVYYNEHCIVFNSQHTPMKIERATFRKLLDFVALFPHYFVGSNADLPIVGGSILSHDHFQGGHYEFAMAKAPIEKSWTFPGYEDVVADSLVISNDGAYEPVSFTRTIQSRIDYGTTIVSKEAELLVQVVTCKPEDFDATWDKYTNEILSAGGQQIIDEQRQAYKDGAYRGFYPMAQE